MNRDQLAQGVAALICGIPDANPEADDYEIVDFVLSNSSEEGK
jgi:hypothetical protein